MNDNGGKTAKELFDEFLNSEGDVTPSTLIEACPINDVSRLSSAFVVLDSLFKYYDGPSIASSDVIEELQFRLHTAKREEELEQQSVKTGIATSILRLDDSKKRLQEMKDRLPIDPLYAMAFALNIYEASFSRQTGATPAMVIRRSGNNPRRSTLDETWFRLNEPRLKEEAQYILKITGCEHTPINLDRLAERLSLLIGEADLSNSSERLTEGCLITDGKVSGVLINTNVRYVPRRRFTLAHEIGHLILHKPIGVSRDTASELSDYSTVKEAEANVFASVFLMPAATFARYFNPRFRPTFAIAHIVSEHFNVSLQAALIRMIRDSDLPCAVVCSRNGTVTLSISSPYLDGYIPHGMPVPRGTIAWSLKSSGEGRNTHTATVASELWLSESRHSGTLEESSLKVGNDFIYTILTVSKQKN